MAKNNQLTVGELRRQLALCPSDTRVVVVTEFGELKNFVGSLITLRAYPDTRDGDGNWKSSFKIQVGPV
jgi:hypothetical protein